MMRSTASARDAGPMSIREPRAYQMSARSRGPREPAPIDRSRRRDDAILIMVKATKESDAYVMPEEKL